MPTICVLYFWGKLLIYSIMSDYVEVQKISNVILLQICF